MNRTGPKVGAVILLIVAVAGGGYMGYAAYGTYTKYKKEFRWVRDKVDSMDRALSSLEREVYRVSDIDQRLSSVTQDIRFIRRELIRMGKSLSAMGAEIREVSERDVGPMSRDVTTRDQMPINFKVAFIGDQGLDHNARAVLKMVKNQNADMVLHQGDFDYTDDPDAWDKMITETLGRDFPYFASVGNHDVKRWPDYQKKLNERLARVDGASCVGDLGVKSACTYKGLFFVLTAEGMGRPLVDDETSGRDPDRPNVFRSDQADYITAQLARTNAVWRICSWHKIRHLMSVAGSEDEVSWGAYDACRKGGAIIATGHDHVYARTHLMMNFKIQSIGFKSNTLRITKGRTLAIISGLGGHYEIHRQTRDADWWASVHTASQGATYGALFCTFNLNGVMNEASCYFRDIDGREPDHFKMVSEVAVSK